ncbi:fungal-specific transcription factor domain-containing protein [Mycena albidolilacea]|uniref:Fungal-specific transcription factor domain-containing protein n=1 Tax=Mycena albidolilacea TaxID=1033008 RepID=A0AAD7A878_9AGAR|nr:fungal-specific transcription factor domain-containing protein [Mycena albidolilacea]
MMSTSDPVDEQDQGFDPKGRRIQRACDFCRRRKTRCDRSKTIGGKCTTCLGSKVDCTYFGTPVKQPLRSSYYVDFLEARLGQSEALVRRLRNELANVHFANSSNTTLKDPLHPSAKTAEDAGGPDENDRLNVSLYTMRTTLRALAAPTPPQSADLLHLEIMEKFGELSLSDTTRVRPFIGKSSGAVLINAALDLKANVKHEAEAVSQSDPTRKDERRVSRRLYDWSWKLWDLARPARAFKFPSDALMNQFIDLYFIHLNIYLPLLHRPTFERGIAEGLHWRDDGFATTVLLVCAIGSRWSMDPGMVERGLACGWEWFDQASESGIPFGQAKLYDLQYYCLAVEFLYASCGPQTCWTLVGIGLRAAQDIGVHQRRAATEIPSVESELFKRAFWVLLWLDRILSATLGRPCALQYEDFDLDPPLEVDDAYWDHTTHPFQQPAGVPSRVTCFNKLIHLSHILAFILKTLYSLSKAHPLFSTEEWEEYAVPELDSALDSWHEQIPDHLAWDPARKDPVFFAQSVALHCWYYSVQILIHRPFIPVLGLSNPRALSSLALCTVAARACADVVNIQMQRNGNVPVILNLQPVFASGVVLLLNVWSGKRTGLAPDPSREMENVHKCMEAVRLCEDHWQTAGLMWDILSDLASGGRPSSQNSLSNSKGPAQTEYPAPDPPTHGAQSNPSHMPAKPFDGSHRGTFIHGPMDPSIFVPTPAPQPWLLPESTFADMYTNPTEAAHELKDSMDFIDEDTMAMWTNTPMGLQIDDWETFFSNFSEIAHTWADM